MSKDLRVAGGQIQSVLTMPESYAKQVSFQSSFESSERCQQAENSKQQELSSGKLDLAK